MDVPSGRVVGLTNSVAPNLDAHDSLRGLVSMAMIREAPTCWAALMSPRPMHPHPKTATDELAGGPNDC